MNISCRCCGDILESPTFHGMLLGNKVSYFDCLNCGYVQTESPYWLDEAYASPINNSDTGLVLRNLRNVNYVLVALDLLGISDNEKVLDYAGGYGLLVRLLRDKGLNAYWSDPFCKNFFAIGFENNFIVGNTALVTSFEAFEHFEFPLIELEKMFKISPNLLFSTDLIPKVIPEFKEWWYYGEEHGQHIGFFRIETLRFIAKRYDKYLYTNGVDLHLLSDKKINPFIWRLKYRMYTMFPRLMNLRRSSKTWQDFLDIRELIFKG